ncbi:MAG: zinc-binding dehydrogenase [Chlamydiia bacterium]|nr:zinc-binding dehydrogenase [Chlamydiia bacterium]
MQTPAAILVDINRIVIDTLTLPPLKPGQVLIEVKYSGVCHTQVLEYRGHRGKDPYLPHCLGHEGSGVVVEVGEKVEKVKPGDAVILSWIKGSGANIAGSIFDWKGQKVNAGAITTFSKYSIISENRLTPIRNDFPMKEAALLGCAIPTGLGVVFNTAKPRAGESLAVFGCGGIGLCAIKGAAIAGCVPIIAVDIQASKLESAKQMGATHVIDASKEDPIQAIQKIGPLDYAIEASGHPAVMNQALKSVRSQGGTAVIIGNAKQEHFWSLDPKELNQGKRILGTWGGDNHPDVHYPRYCNLIHYGQLNVKPLIGKSYSLSQIEQALSDLEQGHTLRPIIDMSAP